MDQTESDKGRDKGGLLLKSISSFLRMVTSIDCDLESNERDTETLAQQVTSTFTLRRSGKAIVLLTRCSVFMRISLYRHAASRD